MVFFLFDFSSYISFCGTSGKLLICCYYTFRSYLSISSIYLLNSLDKNQLLKHFVDYSALKAQLTRASNKHHVNLTNLKLCNQRRLINSTNPLTVTTRRFVTYISSVILHFQKKENGLFSSTAFILGNCRNTCCIISNMKEHSRSCTKHWLKFYILVVLFGSCGWITVNSVWVELPFLVNTLPEGWALPSFLALLVQVAILGPALFSLTKSRLHQQRSLSPVHVLFSSKLYQHVFCRSRLERPYSDSTNSTEAVPVEARFSVTMQLKFKIQTTKRRKRPLLKPIPRCCRPKMRICPDRNGDCAFQFGKSNMQLFVVRRTASQSPFGVLKETFVGSFLCVGSFVIATGLCSFLRTIIANLGIIHRGGGDVPFDQRVQHFLHCTSAIMERSLVKMLKEYVKRFEECGFLIKSSKNGRSLGPLGSLLRQNLLAQWRHSIKTRNTYDCHLLSPMIKSSTDEIFEMVLRTGELLQSQFSVQRPYSVVVETVNVGSPDAKPLLNSLFGTSSCLHCHVYHLPAPKTVGLAFDKWNRRRSAFWKEISNWSSDFQTALSVDKRCTTIGYCLNLPNDPTLVNKDAPIPVETVSWLEENDTAYIRCSMNVEAALATLLINGLTVVDVNDQKSNLNPPMINLHAALAPYKIVLFEVISANFELQAEVGELAQRLLYSFYVSRLNCAHRRLTLQSDANDEATSAVKELWQFYRSFGTLRAVVVNAKTAQTGLVQLWHRSYNIVEEVPISHVKPKLAKEMLHTKAVDMEDFIE
ncbi:Riboflavin transporter rft-1 [Trichinella spiralis]|uniref:Riboflavin transporter rft-1 n=1 Tax=Trichinella spiralis TaxID=6334 RepID=A0ABR3KH49_TRISP